MLVKSGKTLEMKYKEMEERFEFKDEFIKGFVKKGNRVIPNEDFENQIMQKIYGTATYKKRVKSKLKRSMYFAYCALSLIILYTFVSIFKSSVFDEVINSISIATLFFAIVISILVVDNYKRLLYLFSL